MWVTVPNRDSLNPIAFKITERNLPNNSGAWRDWYLSHGQELIQKFAEDSNQVLGNS